ncbi:hypothetical protein HPB49_018073 [Dermacentor silvarum]|uniref:Uncharacterized protein n=1 Tax=Dermacentor silvarum TaxID=543639 RepID=A0ACB8D782_DERSI|nr:hypothetical protein HPB49_018073 [Dermacentor silvarum]
MDEEAAMELLQDQLEEKNLTLVHVVRRHVSPQTIIMRLGTKLNLAKYPTYQDANAIGVAAGLTASEVRDVNIQVTQLQNLVAATSGRESATQKLAGLRSMTLDGERHDVTTYGAAEAQHARCVVHGLPKDIPDDQLLSIISIEDSQILAARRLGQLLDLAHTHHLSLLNDGSTPTRAGNSVQRDTNPDLAWGRTRKTPDWRNLGETFASDHCILEITVPLPNRQRGPKRGYYSIATELTDWDAFRKVTTKFQTSTLDSWNHSLRTAHRQTTKTVQRNEDNPQID